MRPAVATADLQVLGHILDILARWDSGHLDSGGVDLAPERAGCAGSNLSACSGFRTNK